MNWSLANVNAGWAAKNVAAKAAAVQVALRILMSFVFRRAFIPPSFLFQGLAAAAAAFPGRAVVAGLREVQVGLTWEP